MPSRLVSSDSHVTMPDAAWPDYLDAEFRDRAPRVERTDEGDFRVFEGQRTPIMTLDIPFFLYYADHLWEKHRFWTESRLREPPSSSFRRQVWATFMEDPVGLRERDHIGVDRHHLGQRPPALRDHLAELADAHRRVVQHLRRG